jgi:hypothetical protein
VDSGENLVVMEEVVAEEVEVGQAVVEQVAVYVVV